MPIPNSLAVQAKAREAQRPRIAHPPRLQQPLTKEASVNNHGKRYTIAEKTQVLTFLSLNHSTRDIHNWIGVPPRQSLRILQKAKERGYNPEESKKVLHAYIEDGVRSGRPKEISSEAEQRVIESITSDRNTREQSSEVIAYSQGISASSVQRILKQNGYHAVKPTRKPGLNVAQKRARLAFCISHQDWTLEDWKKVIWSDETSVVLGARRGSTHIWRKSNEAFEKSVIRNRWKGYSEFMFWGCFSWYQKGPCHIWRVETAAEKRESELDIQQLNDLYEQEKKDEWELTQGLTRLSLRPRKGGRKPQWRFTKATGKLVRQGKGGIDWYRYQKVSTRELIFQ